VVTAAPNVPDGVPTVADATLPVVPPTVADTPIPVLVPVLTPTEATPLVPPPPTETPTLAPPTPTEAPTPPPLVPPTLTPMPPTPTLKAWLLLVAVPISRAAEAAAIRNRDLITMLLLCFLPAAARKRR